MYYVTRKNNYFGIFLVLFLLVIIIIILFSLGKKIENNKYYELEKTELAAANSDKAEFNVQDLINNSSYSIVGISKLNEKNTAIFVENSEEKLGIGSGIILSSNGYILSNYKTTGNIGETCYITLKNGSIYPGIVKWVEEDLDISILKISANNLLYLEMGNSDDIEIGDRLYLLSNSTGYDFNNIFTECLISKSKTTLKLFEDEKVYYAEDILKTNIDIKMENNGGAVLNKNGKLFGIASNRINAIIPINRIKLVLEKLKENENYESINLGINGFDYNTFKYLISEYPLNIGIYVDNVKENSPLSGKILQGDIITKIDDKELISFEELEEYLIQNSEKEKIVFTVIRGTKELLVTYEL